MKILPELPKYETPWSLLILLQRSCSVALPAMLVIFAKSAIGGFIVYFITILPFILFNSTKIIRTENFTKFEVLIFCFFFYLIVNSFFSINPYESFEKTFEVILMIVIAYLIIKYVGIIDFRLNQHFSIGLTIGILIGCIFLVLELLLHSSITTYIISLVPEYSNSLMRKVILENGNIVGFHPIIFNKNVGALAIIFYPTLLATKCWPNNHIRSAFAVAIVIATVIAVYSFLSENQTSMFALTLGLLVLLNSRFFPDVIHWILILAWCSLTLLAVQIAKAPFFFGLQNSSWILDSDIDRFFIWNYTASKVSTNPIVGIGVDGTSFLTKLKNTIIIFGSDTLRVDGPMFTPRLGGHAHNVFLQTWFELGAIGAVITALIGVSFLNSISNMELASRSYGYALFVTCATILATGWGMWQIWLWSAVIISIIFFISTTSYLSSR